MKNMFENLFEHKINSRDDVIKMLNNAVNNNVIKADTLPIIESLMNISTMRNNTYNIGKFINNYRHMTMI